jgi:hypothetical protein
VALDAQFDGWIEGERHGVSILPVEDTWGPRRRGCAEGFVEFRSLEFLSG